MFLICGSAPALFLSPGHSPSFFLPLCLPVSPKDAVGLAQKLSFAVLDFYHIMFTLFFNLMVRFQGTIIVSMVSVYPAKMNV